MSVIALCVLKSPIAWCIVKSPIAFRISVHLYVCIGLGATITLLHNINCLVFVTKKCVYCAVRSEYLNTVDLNPSLNYQDSNAVASDLSRLPIFTLNKSPARHSQCPTMLRDPEAMFWKAGNTARPMLKFAVSGLYWFTQPFRYFHVHSKCLTICQ